MSLPPNSEVAAKHFKDQQVPLARPFHSRDPGLTDIQNTQDIKSIVEQEITGQQVATFRQRTATNLPDPVAQLQRAIRAWTGGLDGPAFKDKFVHTTEDLALYQILYGDMSDDKRTGHLNKLSKLTLEKQKEVLKQNNILLNREEKQVRNQQDLARKLQDFKARMLPAEIVEVRDGDPK